MWDAFEFFLYVTMKLCGQYKFINNFIVNKKACDQKNFFIKMFSLSLCNFKVLIWNQNDIIWIELMLGGVSWFQNVWWHRTIIGSLITFFLIYHNFVEKINNF